MSLLIKGVTTHAALTDVSTPHELADLVAAVCSETEADTKVSAEATARAADVDAEEAARIADVDAVEAKLDDASHTEPARELGTTYRNTSGKIRFVTITCNSSTDDPSMEAYCDANSTPTTRIARNKFDTDTSIYYLTFSFVVLPDYYYKVDSDTGLTLYEWHEWDLH